MSTDPSAETAHRPWPLPKVPWVMAQRWNDLLFAHWPVPVKTVRALVPPSLTLDVRDGTAWLSIAPFVISHLRMRGLPPMPFASEFPELNVRTYVTVGGKPGVYFFSLDAGSRLAVAGARALYHLPYCNATMSARPQPDGSIEYRSDRDAHGESRAEFTATYRPAGDVYRSAPGSLEHFLTERYCLYAVDTSGVAYRAEIHHEPWPLQPAQAAITRNTMARVAGFTLEGPPRSLSFTKRIDVAVWLPERLG